jgi:hypothetical protein
MTSFHGFAPAGPHGARRPTMDPHFRRSEKGVAGCQAHSSTPWPLHISLERIWVDWVTGPRVAPRDALKPFIVHNSHCFNFSLVTGIRMDVWKLGEHFSTCGSFWAIRAITSFDNRYLTMTTDLRWSTIQERGFEVALQVFRGGAR